MNTNIGAAPSGKKVRENIILQGVEIRQLDNSGSNYIFKCQACDLPRNAIVN